MLSDAKQHIWQILPLNPTFSAYGHSPYHSTSAFAFDSLLISPEMMVKDGYLDKKYLESVQKFAKKRVDYPAVRKFKTTLFNNVLAGIRKNRADAEFQRFCGRNAGWLDDFALFTALKSYFDGSAWNRWPADIRDRDPRKLRALSSQLTDEITRIKFFQFLFYSQWMRLKSYCNERHVHIFGDIPIYVPHDSADVWADPELFKLDKKHKKSTVISGVPPDYFSDTGQLWGHPVYHWEVHQKRRYDWWIRRVAHNLNLFDLVRIDHFRGLVAYWEVPADERTAVNGKWMPVPVEDFFDEMFRNFPCLPVIAEDLGYITADVREIIRRYNIPGMKVLIFGLMGELANNPNAPHNIGKNSVVYTGTHDTNTTRGWFEEEALRADKQRLSRYLGRRLRRDRVSWELIRLAMMSPARLSIIPMQDILALGAEARMNRPASAIGNWQWRLTEPQMASAPMNKLRELTELCART
jgi:4-alpha-glucanotransferase